MGSEVVSNLTVFVESSKKDRHCGHSRSHLPATSTSWTIPNVDIVSGRLDYACGIETVAKPRS